MGLHPDSEPSRLGCHTLQWFGNSSRLVPDSAGDTLTTEAAFCNTVSYAKRWVGGWGSPTGEEPRSVTIHINTEEDTTANNVAESHCTVRVLSHTLN